MGKWFKKAMKSGLYGHHNCGPHHRHEHQWSDGSDSSSDSDSFGHRKHGRKHMKKHMKRMHKHYMRNDSNESKNDNKAICSLCCHQIRPLVETEVLECGHIYHRLCLKELMNLSLNNEQNDVFCVQCKQQISNELVDNFKNRFVQQLTNENIIDGQQLAMNIEA